MKALPVLLFLLAAPLAMAGAYRWVDENGQTHFGDRPPADATPDEINLAPAPAGQDAAARGRHQQINDFLEQSEQERAERNKREARDEARAEKHATRCRALRGRLKHLESVSGIYRINNDGERVFVDDQENERIRREFEARVRAECGS